MSDIAEALHATLSTPNQCAPNYEPAIVTDALFSIARAIDRHAKALDRLGTNDPDTPMGAIVRSCVRPQQTQRTCCAGYQQFPAGPHSARQSARAHSSGMPGSDFTMSVLTREHAVCRRVQGRGSAATSSGLSGPSRTVIPEQPTAPSRIRVELASFRREGQVIVGILGIPAVLPQYSRSTPRPRRFLERSVIA